MVDSPERFGPLLQEKLDEMDAAAAEEARLLNDPVERLRLRAAHLITAREGGPWATGAPVRFQPEPATVRPTPPVLDILFPPPPPSLDPPPLTPAPQPPRRVRRVP